jgi:hypothetical protein
MSILVAVTICVVQCLAMLLCLEIGFRLGRRYRRETPTRETTNIFDSATLALLGLLLAFAFAASMTRFNARRDLIVQEANTIGAAYLAVEVLPSARQPEMRILFRKLLEARMEVYGAADAGRDSGPARREALLLQRRIWTRAVEAYHSDAGDGVSKVLLPALKEMIQATTERNISLSLKIPPAILALLLGVALLASFMAGHGMAKSGRRSTLHGALFVVGVCLTIYIILDLDNPRSGLVRNLEAEQALRGLMQLI